MARYQEITGELPWLLRRDVEGYVASVDAAHGEIYREAKVEPSQVPLDAFLTLVGIWHLWAKVDAQHWIVYHTLRVGAEYGATAIRAGSGFYANGSPEVEELGQLRVALRELLHRHEVMFLTEAKGPKDVLVALRDRGVRGG
jgi:hypothetical protein